MTKIKKSAGSIIFDSLNSLLMILFCISILFPLWDMIVVSFSPPELASSLTFNLWPKQWNLDSYRYCFSENRIYSAFLVTLYRTIVGTAIHVVVVSFAAYPLSKLDLPYRKGIITFFLIPMFFSGGLIPTFIMIKKLGLIDNLLVYVLPAAFSPFVMLVLRNFFMSLDKAVEESAIIDGASIFTILFRIIFPLSKPVLATIILWHMVYHWNAWFDSMIYIRNERKIVLQLLLRRLMDETDLLESNMQLFVLTQPEGIQFSSKTVRAAVTIVVITPIVCVYPFLQKYFVKGIMLGAVKG
ncbi:MAG: carbohydrate ABC transporter permease [Firmicutes bacterium]|nr:carbohydrate ABC transporter permease [Bacillota bacterium]